jgi:hypothetical protein
MGPNQNLKLYDMKTTFHGRLPENIKSGVLSNHRSNLPQILNYGDQTKLEITKVGYLSYHLLDLI